MFTREGSLPLQHITLMDHGVFKNPGVFPMEDSAVIYYNYE
jgi:hypothetical protein